MNDEHRTHLLQQPRSVWAVAFACVVAFMGIGLVDPILPTLAYDLHATPSQVSLLFTSYFAMTGVSMLVTGWVARRASARAGRCSSASCSSCSSARSRALASSVFAIAGFRLGWGLGNALFIATALSVIVGAAVRRAGERDRPLRGRAGPRHRVRAAARRAAGRDLVARAVLRHRGADGDRLRADRRRCSARCRSRRSKRVDHRPIRALRAPPAADSMAIVAVLYNFGFFTMLAYTPFPLGLRHPPARARVLRLGPAAGADLGVRRRSRSSGGSGSCRCSAVALAAVAADLLVGGLFLHDQAVLIVVVIVSGALLGIVNTVLTEAVMARARRRAPDRLLRLLVRALHGRRDRAVPRGQARRARLAGVADARRRGDGVRRRSACCWPSAACWRRARAERRTARRRARRPEPRARAGSRYGRLRPCTSGIATSSKPARPDRTRRSPAAPATPSSRSSARSAPRHDPLPRARQEEEQGDVRAQRPDRQARPDRGQGEQRRRVHRQEQPRGPDRHDDQGQALGRAQAHGREQGPGREAVGLDDHRPEQLGHRHVLQRPHPRLRGGRRHRALEGRRTSTGSTASARRSAPRARSVSAPGRTRTCDPLLRRQPLCPAELRGLAGQA